MASFAVAIFLGLIAVLLVRNFLAASRNGAGPGGAATVKTSPVVVASLPIARGAALQPTMLKVVNYPDDAIPAGHFQSLNQLAGAHIALRSMGPNEPVLADKITGAGAKVNMSGTLAPGMRAVSIKSNEGLSAVSGFALPGDRVDVLLTRNIGSGENSTTVAQALAQNVRVLAIDQSDNVEANQPVVSHMVTIEVTADQAQAISLGQALGTVSLSLRQISDSRPLGRQAITTGDLGTFGISPAKPAPPAAAAPAAGPAAPPAKPPLGPNEREVRVTRGVDSSGYTVSTY